MDSFWIRAISQAGIYATFLVYLLWSVRQGSRAWVPLVGGVVYAVLFEHLNMLRTAGMRGSYTYHPASWLFLWADVPLYVALAWGFILATSMRLTDRLIGATWAKPFCDALLALLIDLSLDVAAIRLRFWSWHSIALDEAFFGVPSDNFVGWLLVAWTFSLLTRRLWKIHQSVPRAPEVRGRGNMWRVAAQFLLVPPVAFVLYLALERVVHVAYVITGLTSLRGQLGVLAGLVALFLAVSALGKKTRPSAAVVPHGETRADRWSLFLPRHIFHIFGTVGLLFVPAAERGAALWAVALSVWAVEAVMERAAENT